MSMMISYNIIIFTYLYISIILFTDEEKVRINKITKQRMINRRRRRRRDFIDTRRENSKFLLENGVSIYSMISRKGIQMIRMIH